VAAAGVPLLEIVSEPDMRSARDAAAYGAELRRICRFLGISDGNMAEGSMRCDVNISVRPKGAAAFGTKVEVKNMNSFSNMQKAIEFEIERQVSTKNSPAWALYCCGLVCLACRHVEYVRHCAGVVLLHPAKQRGLCCVLLGQRLSLFLRRCCSFDFMCADLCRRRSCCVLRWWLLCPAGGSPAVRSRGRGCAGDAAVGRGQAGDHQHAHQGGAG
jgi:hypothetical protein